MTTVDEAVRPEQLECIGLGYSYLGIRNPTVLRVLPPNSGVITCYFVGFGVTGTCYCKLSLLL